MDTEGIYQSWHFEDWEDVWESYKDGLECDDWIKKNDYWISKIADCCDEKVSLFKAFQAQDFRTCSCGGCT